MDKFDLTTEFRGYIDNIDITKAPQDKGYLIEGSQNVLSNEDFSFGVRKGYTLLGQENQSVNKGIESAKTFVNFKGDERPLRYYDSRLELLYNDEWVLLKDGFDGDSPYFADADLWDPRYNLAYTVFVNGTQNIYKWNGAVAEVDSVTTNTITKKGVETFSETGFRKRGVREVVFTIRLNENGLTGKSIGVEINGTTNYNINVTKKADSVLTTEDMVDKFVTAIGGATTLIASKEGDRLFLTATEGNEITDITCSDTGFEYIYPDPLVIADPKVVINNVEYTYTGGWDTDTLTGVTPDPTGSVSQDDVVAQDIEVNQNTDIVSLPNENKNDIVEILDNHLYIASEENRFVYVSELSRSDSFHFSRPGRLVGQGARFTLGGDVRGLAPQEGKMYISCGKSMWFETEFKLSSDNLRESLIIRPMNINEGESAVNKNAISRLKNSVMFISEGKNFGFVSRLENMERPQTKNLSNNIKKLFTRLDFSDVDILYFQDNIYIAIPREQIVLIYNLSRNFWEAPQVMPISKLSVIDGKICGHSSFTPETYTLFTGNNDNGAPIKSVARMSYKIGTARSGYNKFNEVYVEGYINESKLTCNVLYDYGGASGFVPFTIDGNDEQLLAKPASNFGSLGKNTLGKAPLGSGTTVTEDEILNKFRIIKGIQNLDNFEHTVEFTSEDDDAQWKIIAYGTSTDVSFSQPTIIKR